MLYGAMNSPIEPVIEELRVVHELGFDYFEITMDAPEAHFTVISRERDTLMKALNSLGMGVVCHLPTFVSTADLTPALREASLKEVLSSMEVAAQLRALKLVLHPSRVGGLGALVKDRVNRYAMESLETIVARADGLGLCICIENMFPQNGIFFNPEDFVPLFERFPALRLTLDTGHAHLSGSDGSKNLDFIRMFGDRIGHIHMSDNFGFQDNHLPVGTGTIDFPSIINALQGVKYNDTITFEVFSHDKDYLKISRKKIAALFGENP
jgi:sugar phosphate isomerase/epimerase